jgi:hypothetical protein
MKFCALQHLRFADLMQGKSDRASEPDIKKKLAGLAHTHRVLARKAAEREREMADAGCREQPSPNPGVEPGTRTRRSIDLRWLLKGAPDPAAPLATWMQFFGRSLLHAGFCSKGRRGSLHQADHRAENAGGGQCVSQETIAALIQVS